MNLPTFAFAAIVSLALPVYAAPPQDADNILTLTAGTVLLTNSAEYNSTWSVWNLTDGRADTGWSSVTDHATNNVFEFELAQRYRLRSIAIDETQTEESNYPGISARGIEIWTALNPGEYAKVAAFEAPQGGRREFTLAANTEARWLKIVQTSNWGHAQYTEIMELEAHGDPVGPPQASQISGDYDTQYGHLRLVQNGSTVVGCYGDRGATLTGSTDGRILNLEWFEPYNARNHGAALMVLTARGDRLLGAWYYEGELYGDWSGTRTQADPGACKLPNEHHLSGDLKRSGRAILYGVHFDSNSAKLSGDSEKTLAEVADALRATPDVRVRIEGYTDATNTDAYNLDLSQRRAQAVVDWLAQHGIEAARLSAKGFGKERPVADNATPQGRALNRRVEIAEVK